MRRPIAAPDLGRGAMSVSAWFVRPGEAVYAGDRLVELLIDGATFDVAAPAGGTLAAQAAHPGETVAPGQIVGYLNEDEKA